MNIITWNMQGATGISENKWTNDVKSLFVNYYADVACLQESGNPPSSAIYSAAPRWLFGFEPPVGTTVSYLLWNLGTASRPLSVYILWIECDSGGHRNNLSIVSKLPPVNLIYINPGLPSGRPVLGMRLLYDARFYINTFTLHAFSGNGNDAPTLINQINTAGCPWFAAGDYNRSPNTWDGILLPPMTVICGHNGYITHPSSGTNLDYSFKNPAPQINGIVLDDFVVSDHFPVSYIV